VFPAEASNTYPFCNAKVNQTTKTLFPSRHPYIPLLLPQKIPKRAKKKVRPKDPLVNNSTNRQSPAAGQTIPVWTAAINVASSETRCHEATVDVGDQQLGWMAATGQGRRESAGSVTVANSYLYAQPADKMSIRVWCQPLLRFREETCHIF
jgi:hypothetical protein